MKVWIVLRTEGEYSNSCAVDAVFVSKELAEQHVAMMDPRGLDREIEECVVWDTATEQCKAYVSAYRVEESNGQIRVIFANTVIKAMPRSILATDWSVATVRPDGIAGYMVEVSAVSALQRDQLEKWANTYVDYCRERVAQGNPKVWAKGYETIDAGGYVNGVHVSTFRSEPRR